LGEVNLIEMKKKETEYKWVDYESDRKTWQNQMCWIKGAVLIIAILGGFAFFVNSQQ
jgi:hypothetical protein